MLPVQTKRTLFTMGASRQRTRKQRKVEAGQVNAHVASTRWIEQSLSMLEYGGEAALF